MNWKTATLMGLFLTLGSLPWHLPDARPPQNRRLPLPKIAGSITKFAGFLRRRFQPKPQLAAAVVEVANRLNAGADPDSAWIKSLPRHGFSPPKTATSTDIQAAIQPYLTSWEQASLTGLLAAVRFSEAVGAPLAGVLTGCADSLTEAANAARSRKLALTAPKASATILGLLPLGGIALGSLLGANPLNAILAGGLGTISALAGLIALLTGMFWMFRLVAQAEKA